MVRYSWTPIPSPHPSQIYAITLEKSMKVLMCPHSGHCALSRPFSVYVFAPTGTQIVTALRSVALARSRRASESLSPVPLRTSMLASTCSPSRRGAVSPAQDLRATGVRESLSGLGFGALRLLQRGGEIGVRAKAGEPRVLPHGSRGRKPFGTRTLDQANGGGGFACPR